MKKSFKKPEPTFKDIDDYLLRFVHYDSYILGKMRYPCTICRGKGRIYDPNDPPDVIEGNKLRRTIRCQKCNGDGKGSYKEIKELYTHFVKKDKERLAKWREKEKKRKQLLKKLTKEEIKFLEENYAQIN